MTEKLLNIKETCLSLGVSADVLRKLVDKGEIPAYRLGGTILRFRKDQIDRIKSRGIPQINQVEQEDSVILTDTGFIKFKDFIYFNDFYIISAIIIISLLIFIFWG